MSGLARFASTVGLLGTLLAAGVHAGCARVAPIDEASKGPPLAAEEKTIVREQVGKAQKAGEWTAAWNQEVAAGGDRATLEAIAVKALEDDSGSAEDMFRELLKHGPIGAEAREMVRAAVLHAEGRDRWGRALDIALVSADDAPEFSVAWEVYRRAPPDEAPVLLEKIREAREAHTGKAVETPR